jgi:hypothetical protein
VPGRIHKPRHIGGQEVKRPRSFLLIMARWPAERERRLEPKRAPIPVHVPAASATGWLLAEISLADPKSPPLEIELFEDQLDGIALTK